MKKRIVNLIFTAFLLLVSNAAIMEFLARGVLATKVAGRWRES